jgi:hypothetical protein
MTMNEDMKTVPFKTRLGVVQVSRAEILAAMREFEEKYRATESDSGTLYAVYEAAKRYPPKRILELAKHVSRNDFYGGKPTNDVFLRLGFAIIDSGAATSPQPNEDLIKEQARLKEPVPDAHRLVEELFAKTWLRLDDDPVKLIDPKYPGVYVLAYPDKKYMGHPVKQDLTGSPVSEDDIFYVGMTHRSVRLRLREFSDGLEDDAYHSAARRFFSNVANETPYSSFDQRKPFFVASISVPCTTLKSARSSMDLRKMGVVTQLEYYVLARVKERAKSGEEPWLNKK